MAEIVTGEAVALELPAAAFPSRIAALLLDMAAEIALFLLVFIPVVATTAHNGSYAAAVFVASYVGVIVGYPTVFETLSRGKTLGKLALGLRVVGDDGSPVRFRQAFVRALAGSVEIWSIVLTPVALISSLVSARGKRVGDHFAGTYVISERVPAARTLQPVFAVVPPPLAGWAQSLQVDGLSAQAAEAAASYLRRFAELSPSARESLGLQLASTVATEVSPPPPAGTPPPAYLSAVLAVRRQKDLAGSVGVQPGPASWAPPQHVTPFRYESPAPEQPAAELPPPPPPAPEPQPAPGGFVPPA
ncbi:MAG TPA: RDD family protein [Streptosporangiaceae bacterium]